MIRRVAVPRLLRLFFVVGCFGLLSLGLAPVLLLVFIWFQTENYSRALPHYPKATAIAVPSEKFYESNAINVTPGVLPYFDNCDEAESMICQEAFSTSDSLARVQDFFVNRFKHEGWDVWDGPSYRLSSGRRVIRLRYGKGATDADVYIFANANGSTTIVIFCLND